MVAVAGGLVLVHNGLNDAGEVVWRNSPNGLALTHPIVVGSVNGLEATIISGAGGVRCASLGNDAILSGFTLTNGTTGVECESSGVVSNCLITGNGGRGAIGGTLYACLLTGDRGGGLNSAPSTTAP